MALFDKPIALTPASGGGLCIGPDALQPADIIVSTTAATVSGVIRMATVSSVSHAALYIGKDEVIEAVGEGVVRRGLMQALSDDALAVAFRSAAMTPTIAGLIVKYVASKVGAPYSAAGAAISADKILCRVVGPRPASFFCSQLVFEAYAQGGLPLSEAPSHCITPKDAVSISERRLSYVGHLKGEPSWMPILSP